MSPFVSVFQIVSSSLIQNPSQLSSGSRTCISTRAAQLTSRASWNIVLSHHQLSTGPTTQRSVPLKSSVCLQVWNQRQEYLFDDIPSGTVVRDYWLGPERLWRKYWCWCPTSLTGSLSVGGEKSGRCLKLTCHLSLFHGLEYVATYLNNSIWSSSFLKMYLCGCARNNSSITGAIY